MVVMVLETILMIAKVKLISEYVSKMVKIDPTIVRILTATDIPLRILSGNSLEIVESLVLKTVALHSFPNTIW